MLTTEQIIGICLLVLGSFLFGYTRGKEAERRSLREFVFANILKDIQDIIHTHEDSDESDQTE